MRQPNTDCWQTNWRVPHSALNQKGCSSCLCQNTENNSPTAAKTQPLSQAQLSDTCTVIPATLCFHVSKQPETICCARKEDSNQFSCSGCKLSKRLKYSWRAKPHGLCRGEALNSEQVPLQEQLNLGFGLSFMERLLKSKNKSKTLKQQGN